MSCAALLAFGEAKEASRLAGESGPLPVSATIIETVGGLGLRPSLVH